MGTPWRNGFSGIDFTLAGRVLLGFVVVVAACSPRPQGSVERMDEVLLTENSLKPEPGHALVLFFRRHDYAVSRQAGVFEILPEQKDVNLVGFLATETMVAFHIEPGVHVFMTGGYQARSMYLTATLSADKTYYVLLEPWSNGIGAAGFLMKPQASPTDSTLQRSVRNLRLLTTNSESHRWVSEKLEEVRTKASAYGKAIVSERFAVWNPEGH